MTVSNVLRGRNGFNAATATAVREAAQQLGYRPNASARATANGRFDTVSLVFGSSVSWRSLIFPKLLDAVALALDRHGIRLNIAYISDDKLTDPGFVPKVLSELCSDGLLFNYNALIPERLEQLVGEHHLPAVWINSKHSSNCVYPDDYRAGREAADYLIELGHRRIAFINFLGSDHYSAQDRRDGCLAALHQAGLKPQVIELADSTPAERMQAALALLGGADRPTAIVAYTPLNAWPFHQAAGVLGLRVPDDLSVLTFSEQPVVHVDVELDTMRIPVAEIGQVAVEMLMQKISSPAHEVTAMPIAMTRQAGHSCGPAPTLSVR